MALEHGRFEDCTDVARLWEVVTELVDGIKAADQRSAESRSRDEVIDPPAPWPRTMQ
ncbi:hypothetical protein [Bradyrhizobium macuxiense]|uniref:hypothetical protein n=1 Tax=Bradyrhizobium macuxiense TaxID=1755647 RepID=UPI000B32397C|nr:hypothetical protein [Bradyrhizobium macuxiense]